MVGVEPPDGTQSVMIGNRSVLLRADSGPSRGYGHVFRCQTLGAELRRRGWNVTLMSSGLDAFLRSRAERLGIEIAPVTHSVGGADDLVQIAERGSDVVVLDSYEFTHDFIENVSRDATSVVLMDDNGFEESRAVDLVINQNIHGSVEHYPGMDASRLLLGLRFVLIRDEVRALVRRPVDLTTFAHDSILVALGGTDVLGLAPGIARALVEYGDREVMVAGPSVPAGCRPAEPDISRALSRVDLAIIGAGTTMWEALFLGTPVLALVVADNQMDAARVASEADLLSSMDCRSLPSVEEVVRLAGDVLVDRERAEARAAKGRKAVDGAGVERVADAIESLVSV